MLLEPDMIVVHISYTCSVQEPGTALSMCTEALRPGHTPLFLQPFNLSLEMQIKHCSSAQGDLGVRRARYEARWHAFAAAGAAAAAAKEVSYAEVPWIVEAEAADIQPIVFYGVSGAVVKVCACMELKVHPDMGKPWAGLQVELWRQRPGKTHARVPDCSCSAQLMRWHRHHAVAARSDQLH